MDTAGSGCERHPHPVGADNAAAHRDGDNSVGANLPMVHIMDAALYMRPCQEGFLWGVYEEEPTFFDMDDFSPSFHIADLKLDAEILWRAAEDVKAQLPSC
jgi:hypothetical protein